MTHNTGNLLPKPTLAVFLASPMLVGPESSSLWSEPVCADREGFSFWSGLLSASAVWPGAPEVYLPCFSSSACASAGASAFCVEGRVVQHHPFYGTAGTREQWMRGLMKST